MRKMSRISVQGAVIGIRQYEGEDFISLTDMAKKFGDDNLIYNWMRNRNTVESLGIWEQLHNPNFKGVEFETFRSMAGLNSFHLTPKRWIEATGAIGIRSTAGRSGGTFRMGLAPNERLKRLNEIAISQLKTLTADNLPKALGPSKEEDL